MQEVTFDEETKSNAEKGEPSRVYLENPQEKEDFTEATSKDPESEGTQIFNPLLSLLSPNLRPTCFQLLSKYSEMMKDTDKWTLSLQGFL